MTKNINVKITEAQANKILQSGLTTSEFVRRAIDYYNEDQKLILFEQVVTNLFGEEFYQENQEMINLIFKRKENLYDNKDKFYESKENLYDNKNNLYNNKDKFYRDNAGKSNLYESKDKFYESKENLYKGKDNLYKGKDISENQVYQILKTEIPTIQKLLNNPSNLNTLPDYYLKKVTKEYNLSNKTINKFIVEFKEEIKNMDIEVDHSHIYHEAE